MSQLFNPIFASPWSRAPREIACHRCRQRKKKCDKRRPTCGECSRSGAECLALKPKKANIRSAPANYVYLLEEHVASLESRLRQTHPNIANDHLSTILTTQTPRSPPDSAQQTQDLTETETLDSEQDIPAQLEPELALQVSAEGSAGDQSEPEWAIDLIDEALMPFDFDPIETDQTMSNSLAIESPPKDFLGTQSLTAASNDQGFMSPLSFSSSRLSDRHLSVTIGDRYASEYFKNAHPMWPFLHQRQWNGWWASWRDPQSLIQKSDWTTFFVDMVLSIGALLVQNSDPASEHVENSKALHHRALTKYSSYAIQDRSPVLRTQSSLILTVHAMHLDSVRTLIDRASEVMMNCALSRLQNQRVPRHSDEQFNDVEDEIRKQTIRSCYVIDILLSYSTDHGVTFADSFTTDELPDSDGSVTGSSPDSSSHDSPGECHTAREGLLEEHVFRLRRIQYRILKLVRKLEYEAEQDQHAVPNLWRSQIRHDLTRWVHDVSVFSATQEAHGRFTSTSWLFKLANYSTISLFPNPQLAVKGGDAKHLVSAACQVLVTFRRLRIKEHTSCYTWTALVHQFQAGVITMYCLWATPTHQQHSLYDRRAVCQALFACSATLVDFANKWSNARVFRDVFDLLTQEIPVSEYGDPAQEWSLAPDRSLELRQLSATLEELKVQRRVVSLLLEIAKGPRPGYSALSIEETQWVQFEMSG